MNPIPTSVTDQSDAAYNALGGYNYIPTEYDFLVRFAPPKTGNWTAIIKIATQNGTQTVESNYFMFHVIDSGNPGYMGITPNGRYLSHDDKTFIPIGCNAPWPETFYKIDPLLFNYIGMEEGYRGDAKILPRVYDIYKDRLNEMVDNGANYFRTLMSPVSTDVEYAKCGDYTKRLFMAQEMDQILELAEAKDFFIQWNTQVHYSLEDSNDRSYAWDGKMFDGDDYGYSKLPGVNSRLDFFTNPEAKKFYKERLRYILARWGYSTQISIFELISEINHSNMHVYHTNTEEVHAWMAEMAVYIKSQYNGNVHLLTGSFTGADEDWLPSHPYYSDNFDVWGINMYDHNIPTSFSTHFIKSVSIALLNRLNTKSFDRAGNRIKPLILSEVGLNDGVGTTPFEPLPIGCEDNITELRRLMWQGLFSGAAGSLCWSSWYYSDLYPEFQQMKNFVQDYDFGSAYESWRPGSSKIFEYNGRDHYEPDFNAIDLMNEEKKYRADLLYLINEECSNIIGILTNKTYNIYSSSNNTNCEIIHFLEADYGDDPNFVLNHYQLPYDFTSNNTNNKSGPINISTLDLVEGINSSNLYLSTCQNNGESYDFKYFHNGSSLTEFDSDEITIHYDKLKIDKTIGGTEGEYIVLFTAELQLGKMLEENNTDRIFLESKAVQIFPNPANHNITIESPYLKISKIEIRDIQNKLIYEEQIHTYQKSINLDKLTKGMYILNVELENLKHEISKIEKL